MKKTLLMAAALVVLAGCGEKKTAGGATDTGHGGTLGWMVRPWYRTKTAVAFPDLLTALQQDLWRTRFSEPPVLARRPRNPAPAPHHTQRLAA